MENDEKWGGELVHLSFLTDRTGANCILLWTDHMKQAWRATCQFSKSDCNKLHPSDVSLDKPRPPESVRTGSAHWGCLRPAQPFGTISDKLQLLGPFVTIHAHYNCCMTSAVWWDCLWQSLPTGCLMWQGPAIGTFRGKLHPVWLCFDKGSPITIVLWHAPPTVMRLLTKSSIC